jgi:hypothetical protein
MISTQRTRAHQSCLLRSWWIEYGDAPSPVRGVHFTSINVSGAAWQRRWFETRHLPVLLIASRTTGQRTARECQVGKLTTAHFLTSFTSALRPRAGNSIPSASRLLCDTPNIPTHLDCTPLIPNSVAPVSRVGAASCRGA